MSHVERVVVTVFRSASGKRRLTERAAYHDAAYHAMQDRAERIRGDGAQCSDCRVESPRCPTDCYIEWRSLNEFDATDLVRRIARRFARWLYRADRGVWPKWKARP